MALAFLLDEHLRGPLWQAMLTSAVAMAWNFSYD
jgi:hypothetical protein